MLDIAILGGTVVDGTGRSPRVCDVGIRDGHIAVVGTVQEDANERLDAKGLIVAPGFVDPHTHYDAQLHWDGFATPSSCHGVTSIIGGNCGFTLAPLRPEDAGYTRRMMARVEGMPLAALEVGANWDWQSFGDFLEALDGRLGVNAGFLVGHSALRRYVMGADAVKREAVEQEVEAMCRLLEDSLRAGGMGLSTSRSSTHWDGEGNPVPSRLASTEEVLQLCDVVGKFPGTSLEAIVEGSIKGFTDDEMELLGTMSVRASSPLNWNLLAVTAAIADRVKHQMRASERARELGGRVLALTMPINADMNMGLGTFSTWWHAPGWEEILRLPKAEKIAQLRDPAVRKRMVDAAESPGAGAGATAANIGRYIIGDTRAPANAGLAGRSVFEVARERHMDDFECVVEISIAEEFSIVFWPPPVVFNAGEGRFKAQIWQDRDILLGGSDAGAHVDRMLGSSYTTRFMADTIRGRHLLPLEAAVRLISAVPARLFGLRGRGELKEGWFGDVVVFDPETIDGGAPYRSHDFPGDSLHLTAASTGVVQVLVNGRTTVRHGAPTGVLAGKVLRSGTDTEDGGLLDP